MQLKRQGQFYSDSLGTLSVPGVMSTWGGGRLLFDYNILMAETIVFLECDPYF